MSSLAALTGIPVADGFQQDSRFVPTRRADHHPLFGQAAEPLEPVEIEDPVAQAWAEGYARGAEDARVAAEAVMLAEAEARSMLEFAFARFDADMAETLRQRLQDTVMALCEATLVPYAHDTAALTARVERAVAMLARADDDRTIRLHPDDLPLIGPRLPKEWKITADPALERGALRVETPGGGVEDGPAQWRRALAEAFHAC